MTVLKKSATGSGSSPRRDNGFGSGEEDLEVAVDDADLTDD